MFREAFEKQEERNKRFDERVKWFHWNDFKQNLNLILFENFLEMIESNS